jgi:hypothetical protein
VCRLGRGICGGFGEGVVVAELGVDIFEFFGCGEVVEVCGAVVLAAHERGVVVVVLRDGHGECRSRDG